MIRLRSAKGGNVEFDRTNRNVYPTGTDKNVSHIKTDKNVYPAALARTSVIAFLFAMMLIGLAASVRAESGEGQSGTAYIQPHPLIVNPVLTQPPVMTPEIRAMLEKCANRPLGLIPEAIDPYYRSDQVVPTSPQTLPTPLPSNQSEKAPGDFLFFTNTGIPDGATNNWTSTIGEPSLGVNRDAVFVSGNWYASVSNDGGQTFSFINPYDNFPADGFNDAVDGGFCCDQVVYYDESRNALFWLLMYIDDGLTNRMRIAVANTESNITGNSWFYYDFAPSIIGYPASGFWFDFPDLSTSSNYLYMTTNVFAIGSNSTSTAAILRLPLTEMSQGQGFGFNFFISGDRPGLRCTQGAAGTMYFAAHITNANIRIFRWAEGSGSIFWDDVAHTAYNTGAMVAIDPSGHNFAGRSDTRILGAWVANGVLGFMWNAAQGGGYPYPQVQIKRFDEATRALINEPVVYSTVVAFMYPSVHPNWRGHLGGTIAFGGGDYYPGASAWIADDFNGGTMAPLENYVTIFGNDGPARNGWGDYLGARRNTPFGYTWSATSFAQIDGQGDVNAVPVYSWFGRERDCPGFVNKDALTMTASDIIVCQLQEYCLYWSPLVGATSYEIEENGFWYNVGNTTSWCTSQFFCGDYTYRVRGVNICNVSGPSGYLTVTVKCQPATPTGFSVPGYLCLDTFGLYCITWDIVPGANYYEIQVNGGDWSYIGDLPFACYVPDVCGTHSYAVRAVNECGVSLPTETYYVQVACPPDNVIIVGSTEWYCGEPLRLSSDGSGFVDFIEWSSSCGGFFSNPNDYSTEWTPPKGYSGDCDVTVTYYNICGTNSKTITYPVICAGFCGDIDGSGQLNISDAVYLINYIFNSGPPPVSFAAADVDCSLETNLSDVVYLIQYIFSSGPAPCVQCVK